MQLVAQLELSVKNKAVDNATKLFDADTKRLDVVKDVLPLDPSDLQKLIHETVRQALSDNLGPATIAAQMALQGQQGSDQPQQQQGMPAPQIHLESHPPLPAYGVH